MPPLMRTPRSLDLEITSRCNAACRYCYYLNNDGVTYADLPTERWLAFFRELAAGAVMNVCLMGGEPLLRDDFFALVDGIVAGRMRFSVLTNGSLLTPAVAGRLRDTGRCDEVQVSLDGSCAAVHESLRGPGTFAPAVAAIRALQAAGVPVAVRVTVHPGNLDDLPQVARLLLDDLGLPAFSTNAASSLGSAGKYAAEVLLTSLERLRAMRTLVNLEERYPGRVHASAGPLAEWRMFQKMERARRNHEPIPGRGALVGCGCVFDKLAVRADGQYVPCVMLPTLTLGEIGCNSLAEVWQQAETLQALRHRRKVRLETFDECRDCPWLESCTGSCPGTAHALVGAVDRPCPKTCLKSFVADLASEGVVLWN
jgi:SynChlorMet cassette radical SAM/SPASM protein ScmE